MGKEAECTLRRGKQAIRGRALLETDEIIFRPAKPGEKRVLLPRAELRDPRAEDGTLHLSFGGAEVALEGLGAQADRWADAIRAPKGLLDKLGVAAGTKVAVVGDLGDDFAVALAARGARLAKTELDALFFAAGTRAALGKIAALMKRVLDRGALWIVYPKGQEAIRERDVLGAGRDAGLKDVKVARFSDTHTALKFVRPRLR